MSGIDNDDLDALLGPPATPAQRRRQQASQAGFDHAVGLVEQAAKAASISDQPARPPTRSAANPACPKG